MRGIIRSFPDHPSGGLDALTAALNVVVAEEKDPDGPEGSIRCYGPTNRCYARFDPRWYKDWWSASKGRRRT